MKARRFRGGGGAFIFFCNLDGHFYAWEWIRLGIFSLFESKSGSLKEWNLFSTFKGSGLGLLGKTFPPLTLKKIKGI